MAKEVAARWYQPSDTVPDYRQKVAGIVYASGATVPDELVPLLSRSYPLGVTHPDGVKALAVVRYNAGDVIPNGLRRVAIQPPANYFADTFTRADSSTTLGTSESGQAWAVGNNGDAATLPTFGIQSGQAYCLNPGTQVDTHAWIETGLSDCAISANVTVCTAASGDWVGLLFRRQDSSNYFWVRLDNGNDAVAIVRNLAGTRSVPSSAALTLTDGQVVALQIVLSGSSIKVFCDGVLKITYTDTNMQTATKHGLAFPIAAVHAPGAARIDNFLVTL